ncbi:hypothetical protein [Labrys sp. 22185]|uniref:hypothetical protein n=1 Tax=Labrys sp. 22185 TaxID=3453888 RepID=UPI003F834025
MERVLVELRAEGTHFIRVLQLAKATNRDALVEAVLAFRMSLYNWPAPGNGLHRHARQRRAAMMLARIYINAAKRWRRPIPAEPTRMIDGVIYYFAYHPPDGFGYYPSFRIWIPTIGKSAKRGR